MAVTATAAVATAVPAAASAALTVADLRFVVLVRDTMNLWSGAVDTCARLPPGTRASPKRMLGWRRRADVTQGQGAGRLRGGHHAHGVLAGPPCRKPDRMK